MNVRGRKALDYTIMNGIGSTREIRTNWTGIGALFANMSFGDCNEDLSVIYSALESTAFKIDLVASLKCVSSMGV